MKTIQCNKCGGQKPPDAFYTSAEGYRDGYCRECKAKARREWYLKNHEANKAKRRVYNTKTRAKYDPWRKQHRLKQKIEALSHYSAGGKPKCVCCGETELSFLTIDHINGGGSEHRNSGGGRYIHQWLKANGWPKGYQTLCMNCNLSRRVNNGVCAHKLKIRKFKEEPV